MELLLDGSVNGWVVVAMNARPPRRHAVNESGAVLQFKPDTLGSGDREYRCGM